MLNISKHIHIYMRYAFLLLITAYRVYPGIVYIYQPGYPPTGLRFHIWPLFLYIYKNQGIARARLARWPPNNNRERIGINIGRIACAEYCMLPHRLVGICCIYTYIYIYIWCLGLCLSDTAIKRLETLLPCAGVRVTERPKTKEAATWVV